MDVAENGHSIDMSNAAKFIYTILTAVGVSVATVYNQYSDEDPPPPSGVCWADTAMAMTFVREEGRNEGEWVEIFQESTGNMPGSAWCGSFVAWSMVTCGKLRPEQAIGLAWVPNWADPKKRVKVIDARPGDVILLWFDTKNRFAHMGIVLRNNMDGSLITVEGNTNWHGGRDGDGVHIRLRRPSQSDGIYRW